MLHGLGLEHSTDDLSIMNVFFNDFMMMLYLIIYRHQENECRVAKCGAVQAMYAFSNNIILLILFLLIFLILCITIMVKITRPTTISKNEIIVF